MPRTLPRTTLLVALLGFSTAAFACPDCRTALVTGSHALPQGVAPHLLVMFVPFILLGALAASLPRWSRRRRRVASLRGLTARST